MAFVMVVAVELEGPSNVLPIKQTFRGFLGSDNAFSTWIRNAEGRANLSGTECAVRVYRYDKHAVQVELPATGDAQGQLSFALPQAVAMRSLGPGVFRLEMLLIDSGVSQVAQLGILELV